MSAESALREMRDSFLQFSRNGRWGTCVDCPRDSQGRAYPEFCCNTKRTDHLLKAESLAEQFTIRLKD